MGEINSYKDLQVWQRAMDIATACYEATRDFPKAEAYGMTSQIRRAAVSIPANIAEGYGRDSTGNFVSFLKVAQGSLKELETHLMLTVRVGIAQQDEVQDFSNNVMNLDECCEHTSALFSGQWRTNDY